MISFSKASIDRSAQTLPESRLRDDTLIHFVMLAVIVAAGPWAVYRACVNGGSDFPEFCEAARFVAEHGTRHPRSALYRYLPSLDVACIPLTCVPIGVAAATWYAVNAVCWLGLLKTIRRDLLAGCAPKFAGDVTLAAGLLGLPLAIDGLLLGGFHGLMLWMMIAGLSQALRGRHWTGGLLLGAATWLKLLPVFGIGYLVWQRKWKAAALALLTVLAIDMALSLPAYGWRETCDLHVDWFWRDAVGTGDRQLAGDTNDDEDRITNQSLLVVLRRVLTDRGGFPQLSIARLSESQMTVVALMVLASLGTCMLVLLRTDECKQLHDTGSRTRQSSESRSQTSEFWRIQLPQDLVAASLNATASASPRDAGGAIALVCLCTLWFSPVVWSYHLVAAVPATAVVLSRLQKAWQRWTIIGVWCLGLALFTVDLGRAAGHMLWVTFAVGGCLAWSLRTASRPAVTMTLTAVNDDDSDYINYGREFGERPVVEGAQTN